jgi:hypothetical protein
MLALLCIKAEAEAGNKKKSQKQEKKREKHKNLNELFLRNAINIFSSGKKRAECGVEGNFLQLEQ